MSDMVISEATTALPWRSQGSIPVILFLYLLFVFVLCFVFHVACISGLFISGLVVPSLFSIVCLMYR